MGFLVACSGDDVVRECESEATSTCDSTLKVQFPDDRTEFRLTLNDTEGMALTFDCPTEKGDATVFENYSWVCGQGEATISTHRFFGQDVIVQVGSSVPNEYTPQYQRGGDFCGNPCTNGVVDIVNR